MSSADDELTGLRYTFYEEAEERLVDVEGLLLQLEQSPEDLELLNAIFRAVHSIKGGSGACELFELARFAHAMESLLSPLRKGELSINARLLDVLLHANDVLNALVDAAKRNRAGDALAIEHALETIHAELMLLPDQEELSGVSTTDLSAGFAIWSDPPPASGEPPLNALHTLESSEPTLIVDEPAASESWLEPEPLPAQATRHTGPERERGSEAREESMFELPESAAPREQREPDAGAREAISAVSELLPAAQRRELAAERPFAEAESAERDLPLASDRAVSIADGSFSQLLDLTTDIASCSAQLQHTLEATDSATLQRSSRLAASLECLQQLAAHLSEFEARLTGMRGGGASSLLDGVVVRASGEHYVLPTSSVESYLALQVRDVRRLPTGDAVLITSYGVLRLLSLEELVARPPSAAADEPRIAVIIDTGREQSALLVDAVLTQGKLLVRPLEQNFRHVPGIAGATPFGTTLALVLDLAYLLRAGRRAAHSIQTR